MVRLRIRSLIPLVAWPIMAHRAAAQANLAGAAFLTVPFDARDAALGGAGVADPVGTSALFINPSAFARLTGRAFSVDYAVDEVGTRLAASLTQASRILGTFGLAAYRYDLGTQQLTDVNDVVIGTVSTADDAYAASYAVQFTPRFSAGVTAKLVQYSFDCTGQCDPSAQARPSTGAVDAGAQYDFGTQRQVHVGAAVRNFGMRLQFKDRAQADPLPTQASFGAAWDVPHVDRYFPEATLRVLADATQGIGVPQQGSYHFGVEGVYRKSITVRAGYAGYVQESGYGGLAAGFGVKSSRLALDVARQLTTSALFADKPPTYVALRYTF